MRFLTFILLFSGCPVTRNAALRHEAYTLLSSCLSTETTKKCLQKNAEWCQSRGLERACGSDGFWPQGR